MKHIQPITALRNTNKIEKEANSTDQPIFITKNGYSDLVIMSDEVYSKISSTRTQPQFQKKEKVFSDCEQDEPLGFVRCCAPSFDVSLGNVSSNVEKILEIVKHQSSQGAAVVVFPELSLTGYTCGDLFLNEKLLDDVEGGLQKLETLSKNIDAFFLVGAPLRLRNSLYNCAVSICHGKILGVIPKSNIPNYGEFYEKRYFTAFKGENSTISIKGRSYPFGTEILFVDYRYLKLRIGVEICEDLWVPLSPSQKHVMAGANVICNLSSSNDHYLKKEYREQLVNCTSSKLKCAYVYANSGEGESTSDLVYGGQRFISQNGVTLCSSSLFSKQDVLCDVDLDLIDHIRRKQEGFSSCYDYLEAPFDLRIKKPDLILTHYSQSPFLPEDQNDLTSVRETIDLQAHSLLQRLRSINSKKVVVGISGGLDSALALIVAFEAFKSAGYDPKGILAITLPCFGTSNRTKTNAIDLCQGFGTSFKEIDIGDAVNLHLKDIGHKKNDYGVAFENAQARERTQVLMDIANDNGAIMLGTGDLSELVLGWCTYGGDHMSMYGLNCSIPKTLVHHLVKNYALLNEKVAKPLLDIAATPISPELLPSKDGEISQLTEDKVGPYALNDFFIYHFFNFGFGPQKLFLIAKEAFRGIYENDVIKKWLISFFKRLFHNQFKRNCLPDGPKVTCVSISPRGDFRFPSDADCEAYVKEAECL